MNTLIYGKNIYNTDKRAFAEGALCVRDGKIEKAVFSDVNAPFRMCDAGMLKKEYNIGDNDSEVINAGDALVIPGFVDIHTHGRGGCDFSYASVEQMREMAKSYLESGTTTVFPTLASSPLEALMTSFDRINEIKNNGSEGARFAGVHLEGRYINPKKRGAHAAELLFPLDANELSALLCRMCLPCRVSAALELDGDGSFTRTATDFGARLGLAHTEATYNRATEIYENCGAIFTHLYNAMPPIHHREGGAVAAGLDSNAYCELICDGMHIAPEIIRLTYKLKGNSRFVLITDSMEAAGCTDGEYTIAGSPVTVRGGKAVTHDGALAGSTLSMLAALENFIDFTGISIEEAIPTATQTPAAAMGVEDMCGSLGEGRFADMLFIKKYSEGGKLKLKIQKIIKGGREMEYKVADKHNQEGGLCDE